MFIYFRKFTSLRGSSLNKIGRELRMQFFDLLHLISVTDQDRVRGLNDDEIINTAECDRTGGGVNDIGVRVDGVDLS